MADKEFLKSHLGSLFPAATFDDATEWLTVAIEQTDWLHMASILRADEQLHFDYLFCITCVDWKTHLSMHYHFRSLQLTHNIVVKINLNRDNPEVATVSHIWRTAEFNEREAYEMFGVHFSGHPDLRLLILPDGWEGRNPMRKDFEDPINLIRL